MKNKYCERSALNNESDVEQKMLYPLIRELGFIDTEIKTKDMIQAHFIGKGVERKKYSPDYVIEFQEKPILVLEAKSPEENIEIFKHEPQDYAIVLNRKYIGLNPIQLCVISNGDVTYVLRVDEEKPILRIDFTDLTDGNPQVSKLKRLISKPALTGTLQENVKKSPFTFSFVTPDQSALLRAFRECHNHIWTTESLKPTDAFKEFTKIIYVKLNCDKELEGKINDGQTLDANDVPFSVQWLESQRQYFENPFSQVLFRRYREELFRSSQLGKTKAFFKSNEEVELRHETILYVIKLLENYNLYGVDEDISGRVFEVFLSATVRGRELGQFFTPRTVISAMADMADIIIENGKIPTILDACCGTGGFLIYLLGQLSRQVEQLDISNGEKELIIEDLKTNRLIGIDSALDLANVSRMNMYIHRDSGINIIHADSLNKISGHKLSSETSEQDQVKNVLDITKFDYVFTNPPFAKEYKEDKKSDRDILEQYEIAHKLTGGLFKTTRSNALFIERYEGMLKKGGFLFTVIDDTPLNGNGEAAKRIRKFIKDKFILVGLVSMPPNTFKLAETTTKTSILILRKRSTLDEIQPPAFYALCTNVGHDNFGNPTPKFNQLPKVLEEFHKFMRGETIQDQISPDSLQIFVVPPEHLNKEINAYFHCVERQKILRNIEIAERNGKIIKMPIKKLPIVKELSKKEKESLRFRQVKYARIRDVTKSGIIEEFDEYEYIYPVPKGAYTMPQRQRRVRKNDLLVVRNPGSLGKICIIKDDFDGEFVTDGFLVIRFSDNFIEGLNSEECALLFSVLFRTQKVLKQMWYSQREAVQPDNKVETLKERVLIPVPCDPFVQQKLIQWAREYEKLNEEIAQKHQDLGRLF